MTETKDTKRATEILKALDALGTALADHFHHWSKRERWLYNRARKWLISVCGADLAALD
jgi:hypothetical protein